MIDEAGKRKRLEALSDVALNAMYLEVNKNVGLQAWSWVTRPTALNAEVLADYESLLGLVDDELDARYKLIRGTI